MINIPDEVQFMVEWVKSSFHPSNRVLRVYDNPRERPYDILVENFIDRYSEEQIKEAAAILEQESEYWFFREMKKSKSINDYSLPHEKKLCTKSQGANYNEEDKEQYFYSDTLTETKNGLTISPRNKKIVYGSLLFIIFIFLAKSTIFNLYYEIKKVKEVSQKYEDGKLFRQYKMIKVEDSWLIDGNFLSYYKNGNIHERIIYTKGKRNGLFQKYFSNGNINIYGYYNNDKYNGYWYNYFPSGGVQRISYYNSYGNNDGLYEEYFPDNSIATKGIYHNGKRDSLWEYFYNNGEPKEIFRYGNGTLLYYAMYNKVKIKTIEEFHGISDGQDSLRQYFFDDGKPKEIYYYHRSGNVSHHIKYRRNNYKDVEEFFDSNGDSSKVFFFDEAGRNTILKIAGTYKKVDPDYLNTWTTYLKTNYVLTISSNGDYLKNHKTYMKSLDENGFMIIDETMTTKGTIIFDGTIITLIPKFQRAYPSRTYLSMIDKWVDNGNKEWIKAFDDEEKYSIQEFYKTWRK